MWVSVLTEVEIAGLLRAAWIAGTLPIILVSLPCSWLSHFRRALLGFAGRGKILQSSSHDRQRVWRSVFLLLLMEIQVIRRLIETIYVFNYSPSARMHILGYLTGLFFYTAGPLTFCCTYEPDVLKFVADKVGEFIAKSKSQKPMLTPEMDVWEYVSPLLKLGWQAWVGAAIYFWGWIHQQRCHAILGSLRRNGEQSDTYVIPHGDWFDLVSSPHYLAEMVIYAGIAIAGGADLTIWLLVGFVVANLAFAATETHRWYLEKFDDYPSKRHAIIPFIF